MRFHIDEYPVQLNKNIESGCKVQQRLRAHGQSIGPLGIFSLESRGNQVNLIAAKNYMERSFRENQGKLSLEVKDDKTRNNGHML